MPSPVVFASAGSLLGPLVGGALLLVDFRAAALGAAGVFAALTLAQALVLPPQPVVRSGQSVGRDWRECLTDGRFLAFRTRASNLVTPPIPGGTSQIVVFDRQDGDRTLVIGGHIDSWDVGEGAHDNASGVAISMAALDLLRENFPPPKRTIRVVLFALLLFLNLNPESLAGRARRDGTERIVLLEDLIRWGERHTEFSYDEDYFE